MDFTLPKLERRIPEIIAAAARATVPLRVLVYRVPPPLAAQAMVPAPPPDDAGWIAVQPGDQWGVPPAGDPNDPARRLPWGIPADAGSLYWLRSTLSVPEAWRGGHVRLALAWAGGREASLEAIAYLDGQSFAGLDGFHRSVLLPQTSYTGEHELLLRCYLPHPEPFGGLSLVLRDETVFQLGQTMRVLREVATTYQASEPARHDTEAQLNQAYNTLDLREGWQSNRFVQSAQAALDALITWLDAQPPPTASQPVVSATGHAHLDVAWLWPLWRTHQKVAHTVATALHLMERYPDYHFSMSQPQVYQYLKQDDPDLYERMRQRIAEGRFEPVGMMWLETDCNVPSGESLVRHLVHGSRFFHDEFAAETKLVWLPDVFGYSAALPQLMRGCDIPAFMTIKISWNQVNRMPYDTFRWRGIDGSEVLAHFVSTPRDADSPETYIYTGVMTGEEVAGLWNNYRQQNINHDVLYIYGHGDGGGGPTEEMLDAAALMSRLAHFPQVQPGRIDRYFSDLYGRVWDDQRLPKWVGELYLEYHRGTYTSQGQIKQDNRAAELLYREAEWLNAWATTLGASNQQAALNEGWQLIMLNQFHDILPGSSIGLVYDDSRADHVEVQRIGREVRDAALAHLLPQASQQDNGLAIINTLPWERNDYAHLPPAAAQPEIVLDGQPVPTQVVEEDGQQGMLVYVGVPAYGWAKAEPKTKNQEPKSTAGTREQSTLGEQPTARSPQPFPDRVEGHGALNAQHATLANDELRLELDTHGEIASLYDVRYDREVIAPGSTGNQLVAYEDRPLQWDAWDIDPFYTEKAYPVREIVDWQVTEAGPLRSAITITRRLGQSTIRQQIRVWHASRRLDFVTEVDWQERQTLLRVLFPLNINTDRATCEIQFGAVERPTHRNTSWDVARFEVCAQRWVDLGEGDYGVALLNTGKYGHSLHDNTLGLSLLKSAIFPDTEADRGTHCFTYSLLPHAGDWRTGQVVRRAYELNAPLLVHVATPGQATASFLHTTNEHVVVETVKMAEDGDGLIVRFYETHNQRGAVELSFALPIARAVEVNLLEREIGAVDVAGTIVRCTVRPFEVKSLRVWLRAE